MSDTRAAMEECVQIALQYRVEAHAGEHSGLGNPDFSLGQSFAANAIARRIRGRIALATPPDEPTEAMIQAPDQPDPYESESLEPMRDVDTYPENEDAVELHAHFGPREGIRVDISDQEFDPSCIACFQFTADQAEMLAAFLLRSAKKYRRWDRAR